MAEKFEFTAAARLGLWSTLTASSEGFLRKLGDLLNRHAGGSVDFTGNDPVCESGDEAAAQLVAILGKIIHRGQPTLVDPEFEEHVLSECRELITEDIYAASNGLQVGRIFLRSSVSSKVLLEAADHLLGGPIKEGLVEAVIRDRSDLSKSQHGVSVEEDRFYTAFGELYGRNLHACLHRQVPIADLVTDVPTQLGRSRVDFAIDLNGARFIIEIDGIQHEEEGQSCHDDLRRKWLEQAGWRVVRLSATQARISAHKWLRQEWEPLLPATIGENLSRTPPVVKTPPDPAFNAALFSIVLPTIAHRALAAFHVLLQFGAIKPQQYYRVLLVEEEECMAVGAEGLRQFLRMWANLHEIAPQLPPPPEVLLHVIGGPSIVSAGTAGLEIHAVEEPEPEYDLVVFHAPSLLPGEGGAREAALETSVIGRRLRIRRSFNWTRRPPLSWSRSLNYDLTDLERFLLARENKELSPDLAQKYDALRFFLRLVFRKSDFLDGQARVVARLLSGKPAVVLLPTGGGKSLTYQLSGLLLPGVTVVIDPLVALMADQAAGRGQALGFGVEA